jgi:hypothetical protein
MLDVVGYQEDRLTCICYISAAEDTLQLTNLTNLKRISTFSKGSEENPNSNSFISIDTLSYFIY